MKKIISLIVGLVILGLIGFGVYKFFFDCKETITEFDRIFILENDFDYAKIDDEAVVKLIDVKDDRCKEENCEREGQYLIKLLVVNDRKFSYIELGSLSEKAQDIEKLDYSIEFLGVDDEGVSLRLSRMEKKK